MKSGSEIVQLMGKFNNEIARVDRKHSDDPGNTKGGEVADYGYADDDKYRRVDVSHALTHNVGQATLVLHVPLDKKNLIPYLTLNIYSSVKETPNLKESDLPSIDISGLKDLHGHGSVELIAYGDPNCTPEDRRKL